MKKIFPSAAILFLFTHFALAQQVENKDHFKVKGGLNVSTFHTTDETPVPFEYDADYRYGYYLGFAAEFFTSIEQKISIQPELMFSQQGYKKAFESKGVLNEVDFRLEQINLPVLFNYYFAEGFKVSVGPQIGVVTKQKWSYEQDPGNPDVSDRLRRRPEFAAVGGISYTAPFGVTIEGRYIHGARSLYEGTNISNRLFQIGLAFTLK